MFGRFGSIRRYYRSRDGRSYFGFEFVRRGGHVDIYCPTRPPLNGRDSDVNKTHLYRSGEICFVAGREPRSLGEAQRRASEWAEYFLEYRRTGAAQS